MAIKKIGDFPSVTPASSDKILIEQGGEGKSATIQNLILNTVYPVGSIYLSLQDISPSSFIGGSSWERLPEGKALWTASSGLSITDDSVNTVDAGLPNITGADALGLSGGYFGLKSNFTHVNGAFNTDNSLKYMAESDWSLPALEEVTRAMGYSNKLGVAFDASKGETRLDGTLSNLVYGKNDTVQPPAYKVYAWKRIA